MNNSIAGRFDDLPGVDVRFTEGGTMTVKRLFVFLIILRPESLQMTLRRDCSKRWKKSETMMSGERTI